MPINLNQVTHDVLQDLEMSIEEKGAQVHIEPMPLIEADAGMLHQLFENLLSNAIKYAKDGVKPEVKVSAEQEGNTLRISIADNGIGFDEKYLPQMFTLLRRKKLDQIAIRFP